MYIYKIIWVSFIPDAIFLAPVQLYEVVSWCRPGTEYIYVQ